MQDVTKYIYDFSKNNTLINSDFIYNIVLELIDVLELNEYIKTILICYLKSNTLTRYYVNEKKLCIDLKKLIYCISNYIANQKIDCSYEDKILLTNLYIVKILYHELEHAIQEKKINIYFNDETKILVLSGIWEEKLKKSNLKLYEKEKYLYNPIERQANMMSCRRIIEICNFLNNKEILNFFKCELINISLQGYEERDINYPIFKYFLGNSDFLRISDIVRKVRTFDFSERLNIGLEISENEYYSLKEKKKRIIKV